MATLEQIERNRKLAESLQQYASEPVSGGYAGRVYVRANPMQYLARALAGKRADSMMQQSDADIESLKMERQRAISEWIKRRPTDQAQTLGWALEGMSIDPEAAKAAMTYGDKDAARKDREAQMRDTQAWREQQAQQQRDFMAQQNDANRQLRVDLAAQAASNKPEEMVNVFGPDGVAISVPKSQVSGQEIVTPAAVANRKAKAEAEAKNKSRADVSDMVASMAQQYEALKTGGGIRSTANGSLDNIGAAISASPVGRVLGGAVGSENQSAREKISTMQPLLIQSIKQATGMSAQQMNSNAELMFMIKAATDPSMGYEANMNALIGLDKQFGLGIMQGAGAQPPGAQVPQPVTPSGSSAGDAAKAALRRKYGLEG